MKKTLLTLITILFALTINAQSYTGYMGQGKSFYKKQQYLTALERFDLAYEFAQNDSEKDHARNWKNKSRTKIKKQQADLKRALKMAKKQKQTSDSLLIVANQALKKAKELQLRVETGLFDLAIKEQNEQWKGYENSLIDLESLTDKAFKILEQIDSLDFSNSGLLRLPKEVVECPNLKHLNLLGNYIDWEASENTLSKLNTDFKIYVSIFDLSDIDDTYWNHITGIEILQYMGDDGLYVYLREVPENILQQKQLTYLVLNDCSLTSLPPEIGNLTNLTSLYLSENQLTKLPAEIKKLTNLTELNLSSNKLTDEEQIRIKKLLPNCKIEF